MQRRTFVMATGTAFVATLAGCSGGGSSGPEGVVEEYINALDNGDFDKIEGLIHSESPLSGQFENAEETEGLLEGADISLDSTEVLEEGDETATVEAEITTAIMGEEQTETSEFELRTEDGDWKIYSAGSTGA